MFMIIPTLTLARKQIPKYNFRGRDVGLQYVACIAWILLCFRKLALRPRLTFVVNSQ